MHWVTAHPRVSPRVPSQSSDLRSPTWVTLPQRSGTQNIRALGSMATWPHVQREWRGAWSSAQHWGGLIGVIPYPITLAPARCALTLLETPVSLPVLQVCSAVGW